MLMFNELQNSLPIPKIKGQSDIRAISQFFLRNDDRL